MNDDPTYIKKDIDANPTWKLAFWMSEIHNDNAPIGWSKYIILARFILDRFELKEKNESIRHQTRL